MTKPLKKEKTDTKENLEEMNKYFLTIKKLQQLKKMDKTTQNLKMKI